MIRVIFDVCLCSLATFFTLSLGLISQLFTNNNHTLVWLTVLYALFFFSSVVGIKALGRYYVKNFYK